MATCTSTARSRGTGRRCCSRTGSRRPPTCSPRRSRRWPPITRRSSGTCPATGAARRPTTRRSTRCARSSTPWWGSSTPPAPSRPSCSATRSAGTSRSSSPSPTPTASAASCSSTPAPATATASPVTAGTTMAGDYAANLEAKGLDGLPGGAELSHGVHSSAVGLAHTARNVLTQHDAHVIDGLSDDHRADARGRRLRRRAVRQGLALHGRQDPERRARRHRRMRPRPARHPSRPFNAALRTFLEGLS